MLKLHFTATLITEATLTYYFSSLQVQESLFDQFLASTSLSTVYRFDLFYGLYVLRIVYDFLRCLKMKQYTFRGSK